MKSLLDSLKATAAGGLLVVLPLLLFYFLLAEALGVVVALATPIADLFPEDTFGGRNAPVLVSIALLLGASFLLGLLMRSKAMLAFGQRIDAAVMSKLPAYRAIKSLSRGLLRSGDESSFQTAVLSTGDDLKELVYVTEDSGGEWVTVLVPWAPASFAGSVRLVRRADVELVNVSILDASASFANFGVGTLALLERSQPASTGGDTEPAA